MHPKRIRYFTARVKSNHHDPQTAVRQQAYPRALYTLPKVKVHLGRYLVTTTRMALADPPPLPAMQTVKVIKSEEKGADVNLAAYLTTDAFRKDADTNLNLHAETLTPWRHARGSDAQGQPTPRGGA